MTLKLTPNTIPEVTTAFQKLSLPRSTPEGTQQGSVREFVNEVFQESLKILKSPDGQSMFPLLNWNWDGAKVNHATVNGLERITGVVTSRVHYETITFLDSIQLHERYNCGQGVACHVPATSLMNGKYVLPLFREFAMGAASVAQNIPPELRLSGVDYTSRRAKELFYLGVAQHEVMHGLGSGEYYAEDQRLRFLAKKGLCAEPTPEVVLKSIMQRYPLRDYVASVLERHRGDMSEQIWSELPGGATFRERYRALTSAYAPIRHSKAFSGATAAATIQELDSATMSAFQEGVALYYRSFAPNRTNPEGRISAFWAASKLKR